MHKHVNVTNTQTLITANKKTCFRIALGRCLECFEPCTITTINYDVPCATMNIFFHTALAKKIMEKQLSFHAIKLFLLLLFSSDPSVPYKIITS